MIIILKHLEVYGNTIEMNHLNSNGNIPGFPADNNNSPSFKFKTKIAGRIGNNGTRKVKIWVSSKYLSNFCRTAIN